MQSKTPDDGYQAIAANALYEADAAEWINGLASSVRTAGFAIHALLNL